MMNSAFFTYLFIALMFSGANSLYIRPDDLDTHLLPTYDFIVVGGGVAGLVVASRLSSCPGGSSSPDISAT
jgi:hypothetical protein